MHKKNNTSLLNITTRLEVCFLENNYIIEIRAFIGLHKTEERKKNSTCSRKYKMNDLYGSVILNHSSLVLYIYGKLKMYRSWISVIQLKACTENLEKNTTAILLIL